MPWPSGAKPVAGGGSSESPAASSASVPENLLQNPNGEGTYKITAPNGSTVQVPYSNVEVLRNLQGYNFANDDEKARYEKDAKADVTSTMANPVLKYWEGLTNPVGSGAQKQGVFRGATQVGGQAIKTMAQPFIHPIDSAEGMGKTLLWGAGTRMGVNMPDEWNPVAGVINQYEADKDAGGNALALENLGGEALGTYEGGRMMDAAGAKYVKPLVKKMVTPTSEALAESSLGLRNVDRANGRTVGNAVLEDTTGFKPKTVENSAKAKVNDELMPQLEGAVDRASVRPNNVRGVLTTGAQEVPLHSAPDQPGNLSQPITMTQADRPMRPALPAPSPNVSEEIALPNKTEAREPLMSPMAFDAERMPQGNITGMGTDLSPVGVDGRVRGVPGRQVEQLGSTAHTVPARMMREAYLSGTEHPELSGQVEEPGGILRRFEEPQPQGPATGMGPGDYIGEIPGDRGGPGQVQGVWMRQPDAEPFDIPSTRPNPIASLRDARAAVRDTMQKAVNENAQSNFTRAGEMNQFLHQRFYGPDIPEDVTPRDLLNLKRGWNNEFVSTWRPDYTEEMNGLGKRVYGILDSELDRTVPEAADLNQRVSSLVPVMKRARMADLGAGVTQRLVDRAARPTGGLASSMMAAHALGNPLAAVLPDAVALPTVKMFAGRGLYEAPNFVRPALVGEAVGGGVSRMSRKKKEDDSE